MARKVFISFLGTNNYLECRYDIDGFPLQESKPVRFVQEALIRSICNGWEDDDRIFVFCTRADGSNLGAYEKNWVDNGQKKINSEIEKIGLAHRLQDLRREIGLRAVIEEVDIKAGFSEEEIWSIFQTVYNKLEEGDQIYFDVTHAFRSIPLFSTVLFNYSKFMKGTQLVTIKYGAFEKLGEAWYVSTIPVEERIAPVVDLTNIVRLQEYNQIASSLVEFGKMNQLSNNISSREEAESDDVIYNLGQSIGYLDECLATIQLDNLRNGEYIGYFRDSMDELKKNNSVPSPIMKILERLEHETECFVDGVDNQNIEAAIEWAYKHEMLIQEYSLAEEYVISRVIHSVEDDVFYDLEHKDQWEFISSLLAMPYQRFRDNVFERGVLRAYPLLARKIKNENRLSGRLIKAIRNESDYNDLRLRRNALAHATGEYDYQELKDSFYSLYSSCKDVIDLYDYQ